MKVNSLGKGELVTQYPLLSIMMWTWGLENYLNSDPITGQQCDVDPIRGGVGSMLILIRELIAILKGLF